MKYDLVTIGDVMRDVFVFPSISEMEKPLKRDGEKFLLFEHGDKISISSSAQSVGGTAGNVAVGGAKMGLKTSILSVIGKDNEGEEIISVLSKAKVDLSKLKIDRTKKTSFSIIISYEGERSILVYHSFHPIDFELPKNLNTNWLFVGPLGADYGLLYAKITALAAEKNINIALNPGSAQIKDGINAFGGLLRVAKIIFVNKEEAQELSGLKGVANIRDIMAVIKKTGVENVIVTDGKEGAYAQTADNFYKIGPYPGHRVDSTGAGDAFTSAFLGGFIRGEKIFTCLQYGVTNSASVIEKIGAQEGLQSLESIKKNVATYRWPSSTLRFK